MAISISQDTMGEQATVDRLHRNWVWISPWTDTGPPETSGRLVTFRREFDVAEVPVEACIHLTADTRYKLLVNDVRAAVGPARSSPDLWLYDTVDIAPHLVPGRNVVTITVLRFFSTVRAGMPFVRTQFPGLTVAGGVSGVSLDTTDGWLARMENVDFPYGLVDDAFLNRARPTTEDYTLVPVAYNIKTLNGELSPWRLRPRPYDLPESSPVCVSEVYDVDSPIPRAAWLDALRDSTAITLDRNSHHRVDFSLTVHSTAFTRWRLVAPRTARVTFRITYSEGYEYQKNGYPWLRSKGDRLDHKGGTLLGPYDAAELEVGPEGVVYEPFWFRTLRLARLDISVGSEPVSLVSFEATQTNYPLDVKAAWTSAGTYDERIWDISIRTLRNCMFDGYSDCPFYEQLQYSGDGRSVALFHYLLSGDDRLARQAITSFASSVSVEGLTQSRHPSHIPQIIAGFSLYWIMMVADHMLYFNDSAFARSLLPRIDGVLEFFHAHIDSMGLVSGISPDVWQYVDWVDGWHATEEHPDKGVPTAGRASNRHTFFSLLYALTLRRAAGLLRDVGRTGHVAEYEARADAVVAAVRKHCFDGRFFTDSTADQPRNTPTPYSQHCQVFAVLAGVVEGRAAADLLRDAFAPGTTLGKCSYVMMFYAFRAFASAGVYSEMFPASIAKWHRMVDKNLTTWEEDDVRERSDCHAWGSVPIYEFCTEVAGVRPAAPGWAVIEFDPKPWLTGDGEATVTLGRDNQAVVKWTNTRVTLKLKRPAVVRVRAAHGWEERGEVSEIELGVGPV